MHHSHSEVVATVSVTTKLTVAMVETRTITSPSPIYQPKLEHQDRDKPEHRKSHEPTHPLLTLPTELKMCIFDHLDPIDSTSLGLTSQDLYPTYRRRFPKPLLLDHLGAGQLALEWKDRVPERDPKPRKPFCWKCGPCRCELHRHIQDFVGPHALKKQVEKRLKKEGRPHKCNRGNCALEGMGWEPSTKRPCGCWH